MTLDSKSLLIESPGFNPGSVFGSFSNAGIAHTTGTTLSINPGQVIVGSANINDPVSCQGTLTAANGQINLNNAFTLSGTGVAYLNNGSVTENTTASAVIRRLARIALTFRPEAAGPVRFRSRAAPSTLRTPFISASTWVTAAAIRLAARAIFLPMNGSDTRARAPSHRRAAPTRQAASFWPRIPGVSPPTLSMPGWSSAQATQAG